MAALDWWQEEEMKVVWGGQRMTKFYLSSSSNYDSM